MNDFHIALLWIRSLEIVVDDPDHARVAALTQELADHDLFDQYRSPYKA